MRSTFLFLLTALFSLSILHADQPKREGELSLNEDETITQQELDDSDFLVQNSIEKFNAKNFKPGEAIRDAHGKDHGCVNASFEVNEDLPLEHRQGIFKFLNNRAPKYKAWIRFSNGSGDVQPDYIFDGRGMAIKVLGVKEGVRMDLEFTNEQNSQDFLMINHEQFFSKNVNDYRVFRQFPKEFMTSPIFKEQQDVIVAIGSHPVTSPIESPYFSMVPVRFGSKAIKYSAVPCDSKVNWKIGDVDVQKMFGTMKALGIKGLEDFKKKEVIEAMKPWENYLHQTLNTQLASAPEQGICFDFKVQFQTHPKKDPVYNAVTKWTGPWTPVAKIWLKSKTTEGKGQAKFCENLSITPWHGITDHRPMGSIQRVRKPVYDAIAKLRLEKNGELPKEPTGDEKFE